MSAGFPADKDSINNRAGFVAMMLRDVIEDILNFKTGLDTLTVADLQALGMSSTDANTLKSAYSDLADFAAVYKGLASSHLTGTYDFRTFAKLLTAFA